MTYPFYVLQPLSHPWHRQFVAATIERAWSPAAELMAQNGAGLPAASAPPALLEAFAIFAIEAPEHALRQAGLPGLRRTALGKWRPAVIGRLIHGSVQQALADLDGPILTKVHCQLARAIGLRPRTREQEMAVIAAMTTVAVSVGQMEEGLVKAHPEFEIEPTLTAAHPEDLRRGLKVGYHPALLPDLLFRGIANGASTAFIELGVRLIALNLHWPSWRQLGAAPKEMVPSLHAAADILLRHDPGLSEGAKAHLDAFLGGFVFRQHPPQPSPGDVQF